MEALPKYSLIDYFSEIKDPRVERTKKHLLIDILIITICASICCAESWEDIELFGEAKEEWFKTFLKLPNGIPSHDTISRVFARISPIEFQKYFSSWVNSVHEITNGQVVAIDGKTLRHSFDRSADKAAIHMVSAWASENGLVLGQVKVDEKSNEITAIPKLLEILEISGCIVTIDAMGCQKEITKKIIDKDADYVISLKGNQGSLEEQAIEFFNKINIPSLEKVASYFYESTDAGHGRIETRKYYMASALNRIEGLENWGKLRSLGMVISTRELNGKITEETRYFITSLYSDVKRFAHAVRQHWSIENSLHWVLDMTFKEDESRIRKDHSAENFAVVRHIALNLMKNEKSVKKSIRSRRKLCGWDNSYLVKVFTGGGI